MAIIGILTATAIPKFSVNVRPRWLARWVNNFLKAVGGQTEGSVYIIVEVTDLAGATGADSVKITIAN